MPQSDRFPGDQSSADHIEERDVEDIGAGPTQGQRQLERELQRIVGLQPNSRAALDKAAEGKDTLVGCVSGFADSIMLAN